MCVCVCVGVFDVQKPICLITHLVAMATDGLEDAVGCCTICDDSVININAICVYVCIIFGAVVAESGPESGSESGPECGPEFGPGHNFRCSRQ